MCHMTFLGYKRSGKKQDTFFHPHVKLEWMEWMWRLSHNLCPCSVKSSYWHKTAVFCWNVCASIVLPCAKVCGTESVFFSKLKTVWQRYCLNAALWSNVEGSGLPIINCQFHPIATSELTVRTKNPKSGRHVFLTGCSIAMVSKTVWFRAKSSK